MDFAANLDKKPITHFEGRCFIMRLFAWCAVKQRVPSRHVDTLNIHRVTSPLVKLMAGDERWEAPDPPPGCSPSKLEWNRAKSFCHLYGAQGYGQRQAYI
ncbi:hypothetical protein TNCV_5132791 [Trichonephila clavipes]|nr:hypothetical protein TNCV_5132791 [Trichonephila clavipes]